MSFSHGDTGQSGPLNRPKGPQRPGCVTALGPLAPCHVCAHLPRKPREATPPRGQLRPSGGPGKRGVRPAGPKRTSWDEERRESISRRGQFCSVVACSPVAAGHPGFPSRSERCTLCVSLTTRGAERFSMRSSALHTSSLVNVSFEYFIHFLPGYFLIEFENSLYILDTTS